MLQRLSVHHLACLVIFVVIALSLTTSCTRKSKEHRKWDRAQVTSKRYQVKYPSLTKLISEDLTKAQHTWAQVADQKRGKRKRVIMRDAVSTALTIPRKLKRIERHQRKLSLQIQKLKRLGGSSREVAIREAERTLKAVDAQLKHIPSDDKKVTMAYLSTQLGQLISRMNRNRTLLEPAQTAHTPPITRAESKSKSKAQSETQTEQSETPTKVQIKPQTKPQTKLQTKPRSAKAPSRTEGPLK